jgi:hypothetical protein
MKDALRMVAMLLAGVFLGWALDHATGIDGRAPGLHASMRKGADATEDVIAISEANSNSVVRIRYPHLPEYPTQSQRLVEAIEQAALDDQL